MSSNYGSTSSTKETTRLLAESVSLSHQNEEISMSVGQKMRSQREFLDGTEKNLGSMMELSKSASDAIREIERKALQRKQWLWFFIIVLFVLDIYVMSVMWKNDGRIVSRSIPVNNKIG